jgi:hypothetical protein
MVDLDWKVEQTSSCIFIMMKLGYTFTWRLVSEQRGRVRRLTSLRKTSQHLILFSNKETYNISSIIRILS